MVTEDLFSLPTSSGMRGKGKTRSWFSVLPGHNLTNLPNVTCSLDPLLLLRTSNTLVEELRMLTMSVSVRHLFPSGLFSAAVLNNSYALVLCTYECPSAFQGGISVSLKSGMVIYVAYTVTILSSAE